MDPHSFLGFKQTNRTGKVEILRNLTISKTSMQKKKSKTLNIKFTQSTIPQTNAGRIHQTKTINFSIAVIC